MNSKKIESHVLENLFYFSEESKKRGDRKLLNDFKAITDAYILIQENLGTLGHEIALNELKKEFRNIIKDISSGAKHAWKEFWRLRRLGGTEAERVMQRKKSDDIYLEDVEKKIHEIPNDDPIVANLKKVNEIHRELMKIDFSVAEGYHLASWTGLWVDVKLFGIFMWYILARSIAFLQFHFFIFIVLILIMGIAYSKAFNAAIIFLTAINPKTLWLGSVLLICVYAFKKYVIDKKSKALQKYVETKLYRPLSIKILVIRTLALRIRGLRNTPKCSDVYSSD